MNTVVIAAKMWNKATLVRMWEMSGVCTPEFVCCSRKHANDYADGWGAPARKLTTINVDQLPNGLICAECHEPVTPDPDDED